MKIEIQTVAELYQVVKQMMEESKGDYTIELPELEHWYTIRQCKLDDYNKWLELLT